jgi:bifunctional DNA-binding transcriptional regulator/antitoxin component of YhaV-PrlF toxin-antitoxin module
MAKRSAPKDDLAPRIVDPSRRLILPEAVLEALGAEPGDYLGFIIEGKRVVLAKASWRLDG